MLLVSLLRSFFTVGTLHIVGTNGKTHALRGSEPGPEVTMRFLKPGVERRLLWRPALALGESYMDGEWAVDGGDIYLLLDLLNRNIFRAGYNPLSRLQRKLTTPLRLLPESNTLKRAQKNAVFTYDLDASFYRMILDRNMQYTCGYFPTGKETLDEAQEEKLLHLAAKLLLKPGLDVLEIGCGWGNLSTMLAELENVKIHGVTLSKEQLGDAERCAREHRQTGNVRFTLTDYRKLQGQYDRIVSVGMLEHVGARHYHEYFAQVSRLLKEDGVALIHFIGRMEEPGENNAWLSKYIFPGAYAPSLSEITPALERSRLFITDIETWRQHYPPTLAGWRKRLFANYDKIKDRYGEKFFRMFDFYLAGSEAAFRQDTFFVYQLQLARRMDAAPIARDYIEPKKAEYRRLKAMTLKKAS